MAADDLSRAVWQTSSRSIPNGDNCVEVAIAAGVVGVRDSKDRGPLLVFPPRVWDAFVRATKAGAFD